MYFSVGLLWIFLLKIVCWSATFNCDKKKKPKIKHRKCTFPQHCLYFQNAGLVYKCKMVQNF